MGLNKQTEKTSWPLPRIDVVVELWGLLSKYRLNVKFFQMAFREASQNLKAFKTPLVLFKRKKLPMGLASAP